MNLIKRLFIRPLEPSVRQHPSKLSGWITLHEALTEVLPVAKKLDRAARLTFVTSGLDMQHDGRSLTWEFLFFLPKRSATLMLSLEPDAQAEDPDSAVTTLTQRVNKALPADAEKSPLPMQVRDSPEVVAELAAKGADFVAGANDMKLESRVSSGKALWVTYDFDKEFTTSFAADE